MKVESYSHIQLSTLNSQLSTKLKGLVIKNTGSWYLVKTDEGKCVECKIKGNFRLKGIRSTNPVAVGDYVQIILNPEGTAFISEIEDRKNYIIRRASNLSTQAIVTPVPRSHTRMRSKFFFRSCANSTFVFRGK